MGLFSRREPDDPLAEDKARLKHAILQRGQADIPGATTAVTEFLDSIFRDAGVRATPGLNAWLRDRLRFMIVMGASPRYLGVLREPSMTPEIVPEFYVLAENPKYGPEHLVAWWWHLDPPRFKEFYEMQFQQMRGALTDSLREMASSGENPTGFMVDWPNFFKGES